MARFRFELLAPVPNLHVCGVTPTPGDPTRASLTIAVTVNVTISNVAETISVGQFPHDLAVSHDGSHVYVANNDGTVSVIDATSNIVVKTITVEAETFLGGVAVSADGTYAYVTNSSVNTLSVINTATNAITATIPFGQSPGDVAFTPNGARAYIVNESPGTLSVVNTVDRVVLVNLDIVTGTSGPADISISHDGARAFVANDLDNSVAVVSIASNTVTIINDVERPTSVAPSRDRRQLYVAHGFVDGVLSHTVSVLDTATHAVTGTITVGAGPIAIAVSPDGTRVYVANNADNSLSVIDSATDDVLDTIAVGGSPSAVAVSPDGSRVYVSNQFDFTVSVITASQP